ncbi:uncharacterized protein N7483_000536 [Penicillium malachiteum]|uniref:uncharacterized protein n=1 Tax=Penicillium malachiteum TaxID=1324776 RepID=UPI002549B107|nr:uncharacterized protein N7483_000536 [Penicillium malachiteum]KAJ5735411.1 hypothetical protein N7483_000536 [Penicillium malachiteum]
MRLERVHNWKGMALRRKRKKPIKKLDFWGDMPQELKMEIFRHLTPQEIVRCASVSKMWNEMCYDGQLWSKIDTTDYYRKIPSDVLIKLITSGGPFVRDLNLRGCVQLRDKWNSKGGHISELCQNIVNFSLEGCKIDKASMHSFLSHNLRLEHINLSGLRNVTKNSTMKIIAQSCPLLETLNVSWCHDITSKGLRKIIQSCEQLKDLRASEINAFQDEDLALEIFEGNKLERLIMGRTNLNDKCLKILMHGVNPEIDLLTNHPIVTPRRFRHLDLHRCPDVTDKGLKSLAFNVPDLEGLQVSKCPELTDESIIEIIRTTPVLSHLQMEDLEKLTNNTLVELAKSPCAQHLEHLNVSYCESLGDPGMLQIMKSCPKLRSVEMDNTRVSDLTLAEACLRVRRRGHGEELPKIGLRLVVFDCANVTWAGIQEVLLKNSQAPRIRKPMAADAQKSAAEVVTVTQTLDAGSSSMTSTYISMSAPTPSPPTSSPPTPPAMYVKEIIQLKCFYGWQMMVDQHTKRVLRGNLSAANRLHRKWGEHMMRTTEAGAAGVRRWQRWARDAERIYLADDDDDDGGAVGGVTIVGPRARCALM